MKLSFIQKVMNKKLIKKKSIKITALCASVLAFTLVVALAAVALTQVLKPQKSFALEYKYEKCVETLTPVLEWRSLEFAAFLEAHFQSKKNNTYLIQEAITAFREFKKSVMNELGKYETGITLTAAQASGLDACLQIVDQKLSDAKKMLRNRVLTTGTVKHGQILLEKYQKINSQLSDMNFLIAKIAGSFKGFENKFPGYATDCLTK